MDDRQELLSLRVYVRVQRFYGDCWPFWLRSTSHDCFEILENNSMLDVISTLEDAHRFVVNDFSRDVWPLECFRPRCDCAKRGRQMLGLIQLKTQFNSNSSLPRWDCGSDNLSEKCSSLDSSLCPNERCLAIPRLENFTWSMLVFFTVNTLHQQT